MPPSNPNPITILALITALASCATAQPTGGASSTGTAPATAATASSAAAESKLAEILGRYIVPDIQNWGNEGNVSVYFIDANRFNAFKAELDNGGEYRQTDSWTENRDWDRGRLFARLAVLPDGRLRLELCRANNSNNAYIYRKLTSGALGPKLQESLGKYMAPSIQDWEMMVLCPSIQ